MMVVIIPAAFLVAISILVAVHEFGHYWVAKKLGFKVLRFSIGFGKPLLTRVGKDADHTEYCVAAIPLGGYVKLLDEREGDVAPSELHRSFTRRPISHRIAVLLAGPAMNLLFASLLYAILAMVGNEVVKPVIGQVRLDSPAAIAGLQRGDQIVRVGRHDVNDTEELQIALIRQFTSDGVVPLTLRRDGAERSVTLPLIDTADAASAGGRAGLRAGDRVLAVDGQPIANSSEFRSIVGAAVNRDISIEVERHGERLRIVAAVPRVMEDGQAVGRLGVRLKEGPPVWPPGLKETHRSGPIDALLIGVKKTWEMSALTVQMLWRMLTGQVSPKNISGVVSIAEFAGISASLGATAFMAFLAIISVSLGVLNLLPVPLLDGGQVVYQAVEAVKGSPLSERTQLFGQQVGIALLVLLMSLAFYNDISRHLN